MSTHQCSMLCVVQQMAESVDLQRSAQAGNTRGAQGGNMRATRSGDVQLFQRAGDKRKRNAIRDPLLGRAWAD